jgi:thiamine biosynthesis lipoprotein
VAIRNPTDEAKPVEIVELHDCALSVSAVHGKSFTERGIEYGHIIDPRTGQAVAGTRLAAVIGPSPTDSDALSTALLVLGREWLPVLGAKFPGYRGVVLDEVNHA